MVVPVWRDFIQSNGETNMTNLRNPEADLNVDYGKSRLVFSSGGTLAGFWRRFLSSGSFRESGELRNRIETEMG
jgi:hypothetical protein